MKMKNNISIFSIQIYRYSTRFVCLFHLRCVASKSKMWNEWICDAAMCAAVPKDWCTSNCWKPDVRCSRALCLRCLHDACGMKMHSKVKTTRKFSAFHPNEKFFFHRLIRQVENKTLPTGWMSADDFKWKIHFVLTLIDFWICTM